MSDRLFPLSLRDIKRTFVQGDRRLEVLRGISLDLRPGEIVALVGQSGSGKSTLLHIAGLLERPDEGEIVVDGKSAGAAMAASARRCAASSWASSTSITTCCRSSRRSRT